jgi:hypothetical protein
MAASPAPGAVSGAQLFMKTPHWLACGKGTLIHPVSGRPVTTEVVELEHFGRIFEVCHYGNEPDQTQRLIVNAPQTLAALQECHTAAQFIQLGKDGCDTTWHSKEAQPVFYKIFVANGNANQLVAQIVNRKSQIYDSSL